MAAERISSNIEHISKNTFENPDITRRRSSSQENHVNRIRSANSRRLSNILSNSTNVELQQTSSGRRLSHPNCIQQEPLPELNEKKQNNVLTDSHCSAEKNWNSSTSLNTISARKENNALEETKDSKEKICLKENSTVLNERNIPENPEIAGNFQKQDNSDNLHASEMLNENNQIDSDQGQKYIIRNEICTSETAHSLKDSVVLNWLTEISCPISRKGKNMPNLTGSERNIVEIFRKPKSITSKLSNNLKSYVVTKNSECTRTQKVMNQTPDICEQTVDNVSDIQKNEQYSHNAIAHDVEMQISELNKLQITLNSNSFSSEDAAVVIWIDKLPETFLTPKYSRRLSIAPQIEPDLAKYLTEETETKPDSKFEEKRPATNVDAYYPPITILKNVSLDTKFNFERLSEESENSIYFKECDKEHAQMELNKNQPSFEDKINHEDD